MCVNNLSRVVIGCLHDPANIKQLARRSMVISMQAGCNWKAYITRDQLWVKNLSLGTALALAYV